ncbi:MAG: hypothetical protein AAFV43_13090 [Planctomycetota bacterium]
MQIDLPQPDHDRLTKLASAAGYASAEQYATEHLIALANDPELSELLNPSDEVLRASVEMCDRGMAEADAGLGVDARQAINEIADKYGLRRPQ